MRECVLHCASSDACVAGLEERRCCSVNMKWWVLIWFEKARIDFGASQLCCTDFGDCSEQLRVITQLRRSTSEAMLAQTVKKFVRSKGRLSKSASNRFDREANFFGCAFDQMENEFVWALCVEAERRERIGGEVAEVCCDDDFRTAPNGRGDNVAIVEVGESDTTGERFVACDEAIDGACIDCSSERFEFCFFDVRLVAAEAMHPFAMDVFSPTRAK